MKGRIAQLHGADVGDSVVFTTHAKVNGVAGTLRKIERATGFRFSSVRELDADGAVIGVRVTRIG